ncbi:MAG: RloB family protein [Victivallales bacterium]|nr:RloB family protein [Victivallales bacterium]
MATMKNRRRIFKRRSGFRPKYTTYYICVEGRATEKEYFNIFKSDNSTIDVQIVNNKSKSHPKHVLDKLKKHLSENGAKPSKYLKAWIVVDRDSGDRSEEQLNQVFEECGIKKYNFALSNPCFELWLLFHFESPSSKDVDTARKCRNRLKKFLPNYQKCHIEVSKLKPEINNAIDNAEAKDSPKCDDWPRKVGTTVYRLVKEIYQE